MALDPHQADGGGPQWIQISNDVMDERCAPAQPAPVTRRHGMDRWKARKADPDFLGTIFEQGGTHLQVHEQARPAGRETAKPVAAPRPIIAYSRPLAET